MTEPVRLIREDTRGLQSRESGQDRSNLRDQIRAGTGDPSVVKVIVRLKDEISGQLNALLRSNGVKVKEAVGPV